MTTKELQSAVRTRILAIDPTQFHFHGLDLTEYVLSWIDLGISMAKILETEEELRNLRESQVE